MEKKYIKGIYKLNESKNLNFHLNKKYSIIEYEKNGRKLNRFINKTLTQFLIFCINNKTFSAERIFHLLIGENNSKLNIIKISKILKKLLNDKIIIKIKNKGLQSNLNLSGLLNGFMPRHLILEITYHCNLKCKYCYSYTNKEEKQSELSIDEIITYLDRFIRYGLKSVEITGGEPLVKKNIFKLFDYLEKNDIRFSLLSNGTLIDKNFLKKMENYNNFLVFSISLDTLKEETYNKLTNSKGKYNKVVNAIRLISKNKFLLRISTVYTSKNYNELPSIANFCKNNNALFSFSPVMDFGYGIDYCNKENNRIDTDKLNNIIKTLSNDYSDIIPKIDDPLISENYKLFPNCGAGYKSLLISPYGDVKPCNLSSEVFGNVIKDGLDKILHNNAMNKYTKFSDNEYEICKKCKFYTYCKNCIVRTVNKAKNNENCIMREKLFKLGFLEKL